MKVLVTFAVPAEFAPWRARHNFRPIEDKLFTAYEAQVAGAETTVLLTGVGGDFAASRVRLLMQTHKQGFEFDFCISSGLAGALRAEHLVGDILVACAVRAETVHHVGVNGEIASDATMVRLAADCGAKVVGNLYTCSQIVQTAAEKASMSSFGDAVEMESFDILVEARAWDARAVAIRAISDSASDDLPLDFSKTLTSLGKISLGRIVSQVVRRPHRLPSLVRFGRQSHRAARTLADFLDRYLPALHDDWKNAESIALREVAAT